MTNTHDEQKPLSEGMLQAMEDARTGRGYSMKEPINTTDEWLWTDWTGGDCPIPDAKAGEYDLQFTDGEPSNVVNKVDASAWNWRNAEVMIPIIAYRVRLPAEDLLRQAIDALKQWMDIAKECPISNGTCCCGDAMENHPSPMNCGPSPVDQGAYMAGMALDTTRAALTAYDKRGK